MKRGRDKEKERTATKAQKGRQEVHEVDRGRCACVLSRDGTNLCPHAPLICSAIKFLLDLHQQVIGIQLKAMTPNSILGGQIGNLMEKGCVLSSLLRSLNCKKKFDLRTEAKRNSVRTYCLGFADPSPLKPLLRHALLW